MKKPRVEDFDPNVTPSLGSPLAGMPPIQPPAKIRPPLKQPPQTPVAPVKVSLDARPRSSSPLFSSAAAPDATRNRDTTVPRHHDTTVSRYHDTIVELVRKAVKEFGKEAATHRFTVEEKRAIADIIYSYARQRIKTSENEIARIAVNFIVHDYREHGENSVLHKVLTALNE